MNVGIIIGYDAAGQPAVVGEAGPLSAVKEAFAALPADKTAGFAKLELHSTTWGLVKTRKIEAVEPKKAAPKAKKPSE